MCMRESCWCERRRGDGGRRPGALSLMTRENGGCVYCRGELGFRAYGCRRDERTREA